MKLEIKEPQPALDEGMGVVRDVAAGTKIELCLNTPLTPVKIVEMTVQPETEEG